MGRGHQQRTLFRLEVSIAIDRFAMTETFAGIMVPMIAASLPDRGPIFETYAHDLQKAAEQGATGDI
ncbi:MAG: hypothetical protein AAFV53_04985 [Myxococcota bacterium]